MADDPNSPKVLATVLTEQEAILIVNHLAAEGIQARIAGAGSSTGWPEAPGDVQVVVRQSEVARAKELLELVRRRAS
jgi:FAD/FMN-containing dehydrogenase